MEVSLLYLRARWYDPAAGRFTTEDPSGLERNLYEYAQSNPLRYRDPTGYYSERVIMDDFGVSTWEELLVIFEDQARGRGGYTNWGWLEVLRQADDGDRIQATKYTPSCPTDSCFFGRFLFSTSGGKILVGGRPHLEFALEHSDYYLYYDDGYDPISSFWTPADYMWAYHPHVVFRPEDPVRIQAAYEDMGSICLDGISALALGVGGPVGTGVASMFQIANIVFSAKSATDGWNNIKNSYENVGVDSNDILDVAGLIPFLGSYADSAHVVSNFGAVGILFTP